MFPNRRCDTKSNAILRTKVIIPRALPNHVECTKDLALRVGKLHACFTSKNTLTDLAEIFAQNSAYDGIPSSVCQKGMLKITSDII